MDGQDPRPLLALLNSLSDKLAKELGAAIVSDDDSPLTPETLSATVGPFVMACGAMFCGRPDAAEQLADAARVMAEVVSCLRGRDGMPEHATPCGMYVVKFIAMALALSASAACLLQIFDDIDGHIEEHGTPHGPTILDNGDSDGERVDDLLRGI